MTRSSDTPYRINVTLAPEAYTNLKERAENAGLDMSQFVRNSLQVYNFLRKEVEIGNHIYIGKENKIEKELVVP